MSRNLLVLNFNLSTPFSCEKKDFTYTPYSSKCSLWYVWRGLQIILHRKECIMILWNEQNIMVNFHWAELKKALPLYAKGSINLNDKVVAAAFCHDSTALHLLRDLYHGTWFLWWNIVKNVSWNPLDYTILSRKCLVTESSWQQHHSMIMSWAS